MKRTIILWVILLLTTTACSFSVNIDTSENSGAVSGDENSSVSEEAADDVVVEEDVSDDDYNETYIPDVSLRIKYPKNYELEAKPENRLWTLGLFDFRSLDKYDSNPVFQQIMFSNESSVKTFNDNCEDDPCYFGLYPTSESFVAQKEAFEKGEDFTVADELEEIHDFNFESFNGRNYHSCTYKCMGDSCQITQYSTFIGDIKIDVYIAWWDKSEEDADKLFSKFFIVE